MSTAAPPGRTGQGRPLDRAVRSRGDRRLVLLALAASATSIAALLLDRVGWVRMPYTVSFLTLPGLVFLVALTVWARRSDHRLLFNRLVTGTTAGLLGLVAYDTVRLVAQTLLPVDFDAFASFQIFGTLMTGLGSGSHVALAAGWAYHITNGLTFGIIYALLAGPARWWWGLAWGGTLEFAMMVVYPSLMHPKSISDFVVISVIGHAVFGSVVGLWCQRRAMRAIA